MIRRGLFAGFVVISLLLATPATAQEPKAEYTVPEHNAYTACVNEANPAAKLTCVATFESTYPKSTLLPYIYPPALQAAAASNNTAKVIEYADKMTQLGDKVDALSRFQAYFLRANFIHRIRIAGTPNATETATKARTAADEGLAIIPQVKKPDQVTQEQWDPQINSAKTLFNYTGGVMSQTLKDYKKAVEYFQAVLAGNPGDALTRYQLGVSYMQLDPPQHMDGFWSVARAISLKVAGEAQVRNYLRNQILRYQGGFVQCDKEVDAQMAELIALAASSPERPADYKIPSGAEIEAVQKQINILSMIKGLKAGGSTTKTTWLASCGLEFPEVQGKVISAGDNGGGVVVNVFIGETEKEFEEATTPNIEAKVAEQPEAARVKKDEPVKFSGRVASFVPEPFMVTFDKVKVDAESIPPEEKPAKKTPAKKTPTKKAATKRPPAR